MRVQSVIGVMAQQQRNISMRAVAVTLLLVLGFCWQTAFAQNPAGFLGGSYAYAGDTNNRYYPNRAGANVNFSGNAVGGSATLAYIPLTSGAEAVREQSSTYNTLYADQGPYRNVARCTQGIGNVCTQWTFSQTYYFPIGSGVEAALPIDAVATFVNNGSGGYSGMQLSGPAVPAITINFVEENVGGKQYITFPWTPTNTEALGIKSGYPQVHIPMTNGIVAFDFDGNGVADPDLMVSPPLRGTAAAAQIPTLSEWGMILLTMLLMLGGVWMLRRSQVRISLT
jgi:hypothetical protein